MSHKISRFCDIRILFMSNGESQGSRRSVDKFWNSSCVSFNTGPSDSICVFLMHGYNWLCRVRNFYESRTHFVFCSPAIFPHRGIHVIHLPFIISVQSESSCLLITLNENNRLSKFCGPVCLHLEFIKKNKNVYKPEILILNLYRGMNIDFWF